MRLKLFPDKELYYYVDSYTIDCESESCTNCPLFYQHGKCTELAQRVVINRLLSNIQGLIKSLCMCQEKKN